VNYYRFQFSFGSAFGMACAFLLDLTFGGNIAMIFLTIYLLSLVDCAKLTGGKK